MPETGLDPLTGWVVDRCSLRLNLSTRPRLATALDALRGRFLGHALIGSTFSAWDFLHYAVGGLIGAALAHRLGERREADRSTA